MEMKIIKRDGSIVDYDAEKIKVAIQKANNEVSKRERATIISIQIENGARLQIMTYVLILLF